MRIFQYNLLKVRRLCNKEQIFQFRRPLSYKLWGYVHLLNLLTIFLFSSTRQFGHRQRTSCSGIINERRLQAQRELAGTTTGSGTTIWHRQGDYIAYTQIGPTCWQLWSPLAHMCSSCSSIMRQRPPFTSVGTALNLMTYSLRTFERIAQLTNVNLLLFWWPRTD